MPGDGPVKVITDKGILESDSETGEMVLTGTYPGVTIDEIKANVGWPLRVMPGDLDQIAPPTAKELDLLRNVLERGAVVAVGPVLQLHDLGLGGATLAKGEAAGPKVSPLASLEDMERRHVAAVLAHTGGNVSQSARILGIESHSAHERVDAAA